MEHVTESNLVSSHQPCEACGSSDALSIYSDGHTFCFSCGDFKPGNETAPRSASPEVIKAACASPNMKQGVHRAMPTRGLTLETCVSWDYQVAKDSQGNTIQIANYKDDNGNTIAQKIRGKDKSFGWTGDAKAAPLYGKHLWKGCDYKLLVLTEGEIDALTVYQVTMGKVPVASLQNGAQSVERSIKQDFDWLNRFQKIVLCFDMDEPGRDAVKKAAMLLPPGRVFVCELPLKDANDMLKEGRSVELFTAITSAQPFRPDGVLVGKDLSARARVRRPASLAKFPWESINKITRGMREGELITVTAGSGTGKTTFFTEIAYDLAVNQNIPVGLLLMEESPEFATHRLWGHHLNIPLQHDLDQATDGMLNVAAAATTDTGRIMVYDHQGEGELDTMLYRIRYMIQAFGAKVIFIDNLSTVVAGMDERDERRAIDKFIRGLWQFAQREKVVIFLAVHLKRIEGNKGHEDGAQTSLSHLRGSGSISSNSNLVIGLERNQQAEEGSNHVTVRVLKNRLTGETGVAGYMEYDAPTGRLREAGDISPFKDDKKPRDKNTDFDD